MTRTSGLWALCIVALAASVAFAGSPKPGPGAKAGSTELKWLSYNQAQAIAEKTHKPMLVDIYTDWCGWCKRMDATTYHDPKVIQTLNTSFVLVRVNAESSRPVRYMKEDLTEQRLSREVFGVTGFPTTIFLKPSGELIAGQPGYLAADVFDSILRYVGSGAYAKMKYDEFMRQKNS